MTDDLREGLPRSGMRANASGAQAAAEEGQAREAASAPEPSPEAGANTSGTGLTEVREAQTEADARVDLARAFGPGSIDLEPAFTAVRITAADRAGNLAEPSPVPEVLAPVVPADQVRGGPARVEGPAALPMWRRLRGRARPAARPDTDPDLHEGPLPDVDRAELHTGPLAAIDEAEDARTDTAPAERLSGRERRWLRRRRRIVFEEVLGWILVPLILVGVYWLIKIALAALGTTPTALFENVKAALQGLDRR